jgi:hypothetical protein
MRNSHVNIRGNGPDTSELDVGWDFEDSVELPLDSAADSLPPSHSTIRPSHSTIRPSRAPQRAREMASQASPPVTARKPSPRVLLATAMIVALGTGAGALAGLGRHREAPAADLAFAPAAPPLLDAPASENDDVAAAAPIVPAPSAGADKAPGPAPAAEERPILIQVEPPAANVFIAGQRIGSDLVNVELTPGEHKRATISLAGYRTRVLEIDGELDFIHVTLVPTPRVKNHPRRSAAPAASADAESKAPSENLAAEEPDGAVGASDEKPADAAVSADAAVAYPE